MTMQVEVWYTTRTVTTVHFDSECQHVRRMIAENQASEIIEVGPDGELPLNTEWCDDCLQKEKVEVTLAKETLADVMKQLMPRGLWPSDRDQ